MTACTRCHALTPTAPQAAGHLRLCASCPLSDPCGEYQHAYIGSLTTPGTLVCLTCGHLLAAQVLSTARVEVSQAPAQAWDC